MNIDQTYARLATCEHLPPVVVERVLTRALRGGTGGDESTLTSLVVAQQLDEGQRRRILATGHLSSVTALLRDEEAGSVLVGAYLEALGDGPEHGDRLRQILRHAPQHRGAAWEVCALRPQLRLAVLLSLRGEDTAPAAWGAWLASQISRLDTREARALVRELGKYCPSYAWSQVCSWGSPRLVHELYEACGGDFHGYAPAVLTWSQRVLPEMIAGDASAQNFYARVLLALMKYEKSERGTTRCSETLAVFEAFYEEFAGDSDLKMLLAGRLDQVYDKEDPSSEEMLEMLGRGELPKRGIGRAAREPLSELAHAFGQHPELYPRDAVKLLPAGTYGAEKLAEVWDAVTANRPRSWVIELVVVSWKDALQFAHGYQQLRESEREEVETRLISQRSANLHELCQRGCISAANLLRLTVSQWQGGRYSDALSTRIAAVLAEELGEDAVTWETFESLSDEFEGSLGALIDLARGANVLLDA